LSISAPSNHTQFSAAFTTNIAESNFRYTQVCSECPAEGKAQLIQPHMAPDGCGYAPPVNVVELVETVILHPDATPEFAKKVAEFWATHGLPAPIPSAMSSSKPLF
jgi:hypothetical protein